MDSNNTPPLYALTPITETEGLEEGKYDLIYRRNYHNLNDSRRIDLPPGRWRIVGRAKELTEGQWRGLIKGKYLDDDCMLGIWPDFESPSTMCYSATATESGLSLLRFHGIDPETNPLILKKEGV